MDILYVNAEEFCRNVPFQGWTDTGNSKEKTRSSWSVIWVKYHERILFAENSEVKKKTKLEKTAAIKDTTKKSKCESWSDDSEPLTGARNCLALGRGRWAVSQKKLKLT